jgi:3D (Asp-Asp-Asp) domain-containing protein
MQSLRLIQNLAPNVGSSMLMVSVLLSGVPCVLAQVDRFRVVTVAALDFSVIPQGTPVRVDYHATRVHALF